MPAQNIFFGLSPSQYQARNPRRLGFEVSPLGYDDGRYPACAINGNDQLIAVHMGSSSDTLNFRRGIVERLDLRWRDSKHSSFGNGNNPAVAFSDTGVAIVMADQNNRLKWAAATVDPDADANPAFQFSTTFNASDAAVAASTRPSVAVNRSGVVLEVHEGPNNLLFFRRGQLQGAALTWGGLQSFPAQGRQPFVAINNSGQAVAVFLRGNDIYYSIGAFSTTVTNAAVPILFNAAQALGSTGLRPTVALTDQGAVFITYQRSSGPRELFQVVGQLDGSTIRKQDFLVPGTFDYKYDDGTDAQVATNGKVAVQVFHAGGSTGNQLRANASAIFDRANWMGDNREYFKVRTLRRIAMPASHDAGAFAANNARTQDLTIAQQLNDGVRYFDIRPIYTGDHDQPLDAAKFFTYHNIDVEFIDPNYIGPAITDVVAQVRSFMATHKELVILKISHFYNFNAAVFAKLAELLVGPPQDSTTSQNAATGLRQWLFTPRTDGRRLADRRLEDYLLPDRGTVMVVVDVDGTNDYVTDELRTQGMFRYRDWYASDPDKGDLTVFDIFSDVTQFDEMALNGASSGYLDANGRAVPAGQLNKFDVFNGNCQKKVNGETVQCDLFLLSWTLTPNVPGAAPNNRGTAFARAEGANRNLAAYLAIPAFQGTNPKGLRMNLLYVDAVEFSRATDVAMIRNGLGR